MSSRRIYVSVYDDIDDKTALHFAGELLKVLPREEGNGVVRWSNGICAGYSDHAKKCLVIQVWRTQV